MLKKTRLKNEKKNISLNIPDIKYKKNEEKTLKGHGICEDSNLWLWGSNEEQQ